MSALLTESVVCDRIAFLLGNGRLDAEVDLIDTRENALALEHGFSAASEQHFTTESVDAAILSFLDTGDATPLRVVVLPQVGSQHFDLSTTHGSGTGEAQIDETLSVEVHVHADNPGLLGGVQWHRTGALRRALRVAKAVEALLLRYPRLDVPAPDSLLGIAQWVTLEGMSRVDSNPESPENVTIRVPLGVRVTGKRG